MQPAVFAAFLLLWSNIRGSCTTVMSHAHIVLLIDRDIIYTSVVVLRLEPKPKFTESRMDVVGEALVALTAASGLSSLQGHDWNLANEWNEKV
jgi:hypothetical protein